MSTESITIALDGKDVKGTEHVHGHAEDNQIVHFTDGGDISGNLTVSFFGMRGHTEAGAGPGGDDQFSIDLSQFDDDFEIRVKSMDSGDVFHVTSWDTHSVSGTVHEFTFTGSDGETHSIKLDAQSLNGEKEIDVVKVVCFVRGTAISVPGGTRRIEELHAGDPVCCADGKDRPVRWIGSRRLSPEVLRANPELRPIRIRKDAFGKGMPTRALTLSPQHGVLLRDRRAEMLFGTPKVLAPVKALCNDDSIRQQWNGKSVQYFHILLDSHQIIYANGVETETLFTADALRGAVKPEARDEICQIFPELAGDLSAHGPTCAPVLKAYEVAALRS